MFDHLIVLMLENRSFDNLLGFLYDEDSPHAFVGRGEPAFRGVAHRNDLWNEDGAQPPRRIAVARAAWQTPLDMCQPSPDPGEGYRHCNVQLYGTPDVAPDAAALPPAPMSGFVRDYIAAIGAELVLDGVQPTATHYERIMHCFPPDALPVLSGLAHAFAVSDEWFAAVPSQTFTNRSFLHSAQSHGFVDNADYIKWLHNDGVTIFERLSAALPAGHDWRVYWDPADVEPITRLLHTGLRHHTYSDRFRDFATFAEDCRRGDLPAYTFIQPRVLINHNDMHPPVVLNPDVQSSVLAGELLVNTIYDAVRTGAAWERTLLVILFDEHGGCYDHWPPPVGATPPVAAPPYPLEHGFRFDRFGVRVPAIFVSPWIAPGTVVRAGGAVPFDHTSVIRTLCERWSLEPLTERDRHAPDFTSVMTLSTSDMRRVTPSFQPRPYVPQTKAQAHETLLSGFQQEAAKLITHARGLEVRTFERVRHFLAHLG